MEPRRRVAALILLLGAGLVSFTAWDLSTSASGKRDVWYFPTTHEVVEHMLRLGEVTSRDIIYDLGCGDGRIVIAAAKRFGARGVGIDIDPKLIEVARLTAEAEGVEHLVRFEVGDLFEADFSEATVVMLYLLPEMNRRLRPRLQRELQPHARIVAHDFHLGPEWPPEQTVDFGADVLYRWTVPPRRASSQATNPLAITSSET